MGLEVMGGAEEQDMLQVVVLAIFIHFSILLQDLIDKRCRKAGAGDRVCLPFNLIFFKILFKMDVKRRSRSRQIPENTVLQGKPHILCAAFRHLRLVSPEDVTTSM